MTLRTVRAYGQTIFSGLVLLAIMILIVLQWGNNADFTAYGPHYDVNTAVLILLSALGGIVVVALSWVFVNGVVILARGRSQKPEKMENPSK